MTYIETLIASTAPDAPPSILPDLLAVARFEGMTAADAIADRRALLAWRDRPSAADVDAAGRDDAEAADAVQTARTARDAAQSILDHAETSFVTAHKAAALVTQRAAAAERALTRPNVKNASETIH